jgi:hypothetical protein
MTIIISIICILVNLILGYRNYKRELFAACSINFFASGACFGLFIADLINLQFK